MHRMSSPQLRWNPYTTILSGKSIDPEGRTFPQDIRRPAHQIVCTTEWRLLYYSQLESRTAVIVIEGKRWDNLGEG